MKFHLNCKTLRKLSQSIPGGQQYEINVKGEVEENSFQFYHINHNFFSFFFILFANLLLEFSTLFQEMFCMFFHLFSFKLSYTSCSIIFYLTQIIIKNIKTSKKNIFIICLIAFFIIFLVLQGFFKERVRKIKRITLVVLKWKLLKRKFIRGFKS